VSAVDGEEGAAVKKNPLLAEAESLRPDESLEEVKSVLDRLLLYLRVVHSIDYYNQVLIVYRHLQPLQYTRYRYVSTDIHTRREPATLHCKYRYIFKIFKKKELHP
jgi:hypothetical protein